jgi:drug/metabolite transporter (DMT)-like permease
MTKCFLVASLTVLGTINPLIIKASRVREGNAYTPEMVTCCAEAVKALFSFCALLRCRDALKAERSITLKILLIALVYAARNNLMISIVRSVDVATFQILFIWRIPVTAFMMRSVMGRRFSSRQKAAVCLLVAGTIFSQWHDVRASGMLTIIEKNHTRLTRTVGMLMLALIMTSSLGGVLNEAMLKKEGMGSLHLQNVQLYGFGFFINLGIVAWREGRKPYRASMWSTMSDWTWLTWMTVWSMSAMGILTSATLKYADNLVRALAAAGSILMGAWASWAWFGAAMSSLFVCGSALTCIAAVLYMV